MNEQGDATGGKPDVVVLYCQRCVCREARKEPAVRNHPDGRVRLVMLPCSSKVEASFVLKLLAAGADGVEIAACPEARCRFLIGNTKAEKRLAFVQNLLEESHVGRDRVGMTRGSQLSVDDLVEIGAARARAAGRLTPDGEAGDKKAEGQARGG